MKRKRFLLHMLGTLVLIVVPAAAALSAVFSFSGGDWISPPKPCIIAGITNGSIECPMIYRLSNNTRPETDQLIFQGCHFRRQPRLCHKKVILSVTLLVFIRIVLRKGR